MQIVIEIGQRSPLRVRPVRLNLAVSRKIRLLYASDLHFSPWSTHLAEQLLKVVSEARPDALLLGGDLVDWPCGFKLFRRFLERLDLPVLAVPGNHDRLAGIERLRRTILQTGGRWLPDAPVEMPGGLRLHGRIQDRPVDQAILVAHNPAVFPAAVSSGYPLVLAGHLHGSNVALFQWRGRLYPGAWLFRYNGLRFRRGSTTMEVSLGVGDTVPLRWNCPRDVLLVDVRARPEVSL